MGRWSLRRAARLATAATGIWLTAAATAHAVTVPHSGWEWGLPQPQGNNLREVEFAGNRAYAVGAFGTLLRSDDGGTSWTGIPTDAPAELSVLEIAGRPDALVFGGECELWRSDDGGRTLSGSFRSQTTCDSSGHVVDASFPSPDAGYVVLRDNRVLRMVGGRLSSADPATPVPNVSYPVAMEFVSASTGVVLTGTGTIFRTTDGAASWTQVVSADDVGELASVHFVDASTGYAAGNQTWLKTSNGGASWQPLAIPPGANRQLQQIRCADANTCLITNYFPGTDLLRTGDGGATAAQVATPTAVGSVAFASPARAVAVGARTAGFAYRSATTVSDDGGLTWRQIGSAPAHGFAKVRAKTQNTAFAFGGRGLVRTSDGGRTWLTLGEIPLLRGDDRILDVSFPAATVGYVLDNNGRVRRSASGGTTWQVVSERQFAYALHAPDPSTVLLIGSRGIRRSTDGGRHFRPATVGRFAPGSTRELAQLTDVDQAGSALVASGPQALYLSQDQGRTWRELRRPGRGLLPVRRELDAVDFVSARAGYAVSGGRLFFTRDGGRPWREVVATGVDDVYDLAFSTEQSGWLAVKERFGRGPASEDGSYVLRTTNGGREWRPQLVSERAILSLAAIGRTGLIAFNPVRPTSPASGVLYTHSGGDSGAASALRLTTGLRRLPRRARITVRGRLVPGGSGRVTIAYRGDFFVDLFGGGRQQRRYAEWQYASARVGPDGTFSRRFPVDGTAEFVALFPGDRTRRPAGSAALEVTAESPF